MKYRFQKGLKILNALMGYCHSIGGMDYHMDMRMLEHETVFYISTPVHGMDGDAVKKIEEVLNTPRQREIEQNYWGLGGESTTMSGLALVGMMVDEAMVEYGDGYLTLVVKRLEGRGE